VRTSCSPARRGHCTLRGTPPSGRRARRVSERRAGRAQHADGRHHDEYGYDKPEQRVRERIAEPHGHETSDDAERDKHIATGMARVRYQDLASESLPARRSRVVTMMFTTSVAIMTTKLTASTAGPRRD